MGERRRARRALALACLVLQGTVSLAWAIDEEPDAPVTEAVLVGAGGIASCDTAGDEATAELLEDVVKEHPDAVVFTAGDNAYDKGTAKQFAKCYDKTWGKFKDRTRPASGNHDHATSGAEPYYEYFGAAAGEKKKGWYSYDLGGWHIISLNSNCKHNTKCAPDSEQVQWLKADLAASAARCTAAVIHHPRFSSDKVDGSLPHVAPLWDVLYAAGADLVISGHARVYERFAPQTPDGVLDEAYGLPLFNVGTGGRGHAGFEKKPVANSLVRDDTSWGVLKLTLRADSFDFEFLPVAGKKFTDAGTLPCHGKPGSAPEEPGETPEEPGETPDEPGETPEEPGSDPEPEPEPETPASVSFPADSDATVAKESPKKNYGSKSTLVADKAPKSSGLLRFTVTEVDAPVKSARLRLWVVDGSGNAPALYPTDATWSESDVTWKTRPDRVGEVIDDLGSVKAKHFVEYDVSDVITGDGVYSFELAPTAKDGTDFASSESSKGERRPELILDLG